VELLKFEFIFSNLEIDAKPDLSASTFLWIWKPLEIAPHAGLSISGEYFSLTATGKELHIDTTKLLALVNKKSTPLLLIEMRTEITKKDVLRIFDSYECASQLNSSCIQPISQLLDCPSGKLAELLYQLEGRELLGKTYALNIEESTIGILYYDVIAIEKKLISLQHAKRR